MKVYYAFYLVDGRGYVGSTVKTLENRFKGHLIASTFFGNALRKYGPENFKLVQIDTATNLQELREKEAYWIETLDTFGSGGFNLIDPSRLTIGWNSSEETRRAMSLAHTGNHLSEDHKQKISSSLIGKVRDPHTQDTKKALSAAFSKISPEQLALIVATPNKSKWEWASELGVSWATVHRAIKGANHVDQSR